MENNAECDGGYAWPEMDEKRFREEYGQEIPEIPAEVRYVMEKFRIGEREARMAISNGLRVDELRDGTASRKFMDDSGIGPRVSRMEREVDSIKVSSRAKSRE